MGVLEDAIREHLELKRAHGASDEEVEREETEALGPARRPAPAEAEDAGDGELPVDEEDFEPDELAAEEELAPEGELPPEPLYEDELEDDLEPEGGVGPAPEDFHSELPPEPVAPPADFAGDFDEPPAAESEPEPEPFGFDEEEPGVAPPMPERAPAEEEAEPDGPEAAADDVLEDTPDFLQDTPEHDRLWFEQKPPRDFDFD